MTKAELDRDLTRRCLEERWIPRTLGEAGGPCALCEKYSPSNQIGACLGCPIYLKTGAFNCQGTPYRAWGKEQTVKNARAMTDWLWMLYGKLAEKMLAERKDTSRCIICNAASVPVYYGGIGPICGACSNTCFANGHYLVPVVRGGPWALLHTPWEEWEDGVYTSMSAIGYRVRKGEIQREYHGVWFTSAYARPGVEFRAPEPYTGPLPEGCRWAEGSEPKPLETKYPMPDRCRTCKHAPRGLRTHPCYDCSKTNCNWEDSDCKADKPKPRPKADTASKLGPVIPTLARDEDVKELRKEVRRLAQLIRRHWNGVTSKTTLEALIDRLGDDGGKG